MKKQLNYADIIKEALILTGAEAIIAAVKEVHVTVPVVVRLEGNNAELGAQILRDSGLQLIPAEGLADAAQKIVDAVKA